MKKFFKFIFQPILGKKKFQMLFQKLYLLSLKGMNFGYALVENTGEKNLLKILRKNWRNKEPIVIFDVGANMGDYLAAINDCFGVNCPSLKIYAFEPVQKTFTRLLENFGAQQNVYLQNLGLGDKLEHREIFSDAGVSGLYSVYARKVDNLSKTFQAEGKVEIQTLDQFCESQKISHIHLLKLDVEGHELSVLKGAQGLLANGKIDYIQFEFGGVNIDSRTYLRDFFQLLHQNYNFYRILQDGLLPIPIYNETQEIFFTANYLAVKKELVL